MSHQAWQTVETARHADRPYALDHIVRLAPDFIELHGDRVFGDDAALVAGIGTWDAGTTVFLGQQKGRDFEERIRRNFGMMHPEGYRKAIRLAHVATHLRFPVICLVDTPGAYPGLAAEERGIAYAIGRAIVQWFRVDVPVVAVVIGEGGSGGAAALAVADRVLMLEHSIYSVAMPEACASILWRDVAHRADAAHQLRLTAADALRLGVVDEIITEPSGGAHLDHDLAAKLLEDAVRRHMAPLRVMPPTTLLHERRQRFRDRWVPGEQLSGLRMTDA